MNEIKMTVPAHVPPELVFDFDYYNGPETTKCPHTSLVSLQQKPDLFYTPRNGGHWVVVRLDDAVTFLQKPEIFSSDPDYADPSLKMTAVRRIPLDVDPPEHTNYRRLLNPLFSPAAIHKLDEKVRVFASRLIDTVASKGECDFIAEIAKLYPPEIFLWLMGISPDRREVFIGWVDTWFRSSDPKIALAASQKVTDFMRETLEERKANPGEDLLSQLTKLELDGQKLTSDELVGMGVLLFIGGLDTVVATLTFIMQFLANNYAHTKRLVDDPALIPAALEEILRRYTISLTYKYVTQDITIKDVSFRKGDRLLFVYPLYGIDDRNVENPLEVDFDRTVSRHLAFSAGPHRCLGSHLARLEMRVFLEEWLKKIPEFKIKSGVNLKYRGGKILEINSLPLIWDVN